MFSSVTAGTPAPRGPLLHPAEQLQRQQFGDRLPTANSGYGHARGRRRMGEGEALTEEQRAEHEAAQEKFWEAKKPRAKRKPSCPLQPTTTAPDSSSWSTSSPASSSQQSTSAASRRQRRSASPAASQASKLCIATPTQSMPEDQIAQIGADGRFLPGPLFGIDGAHRSGMLHRGVWLHVLPESELRLE